MQTDEHEKLIPGTTPAALCFIISAPRSGSTWLRTALDAHPDIFCTENRLFGSHADFVRDHDADRAAPRLRITLDRYVESFLEPFNVAGLPVSRSECRSHLVAELARSIVTFCRTESGKPIVADKVTPYRGTADRVVAAITTIFPHAKIVHLRRDGRDVLVSGAFHWLTKTIDGKPPDAIAVRRRAFLLGDSATAGGSLERLLSDDELEDWAMMWREPIGAVRSIRDRSAIMELSYEQMKTNQPECLARVCRFLGAPAAAPVIDDMVTASSFARMSGGRTPEAAATASVRKGAVGDWKNYLTRGDGERFDALAGDELVALGYAKDRRWFETLPSVLAPALESLEVART